MSVEKKCLECAVIIVDEWFLTCQGFMCDKVISYNCATSQAKKIITKFPKDVKSAMKHIFDGLPGLSWFCPSCRINMNQWHSKLDTVVNKITKSNESLNDAIQALTKIPKVTEDRRITRSQSKVQVDSSIKPLQTKTPLVTRPISTATASPTIILTEETSRIKLSQAGLSTTVPDFQPPDVALSTPQTVQSKTIPRSQPSEVLSHTVSKSKEIPVPDAQMDVSTNLIPHVSIASSQVLSKEDITENLNKSALLDIKVVAPRRWLFVSRIAETTSKQHFEDFLKSRMKLDGAACVEMPPNRDNGLKYNYTSFRISVSEEQFSNILYSKMWPPGLLVKEFVWRTRRQNFRNICTAKNFS